MTVAYLEMTDVHKRFGGVVALDGASLTAELGRIHALVGPNGSGKSTLNKTLTGVVAPDRAEIRVDGERVAFRSPQQAQRHGIAAVYQDLSLVPQLTAVDNIQLGIEASAALGYLDRGEQTRRAREVMERFRPAFEGRLALDVPVGRLSPGEQQIVEVCKAIARDPRILILDEATASLHQAQVEVLFDAVRELRDRDVLTVFTSHRMDEVYDLCDSATVLRGGETIGEVMLADTGRGDLVEMMVGHRMDQAGSARHERSGEGLGGRDVVLEVRGVRTDVLHDVSFTVHAGEIVGLGGLQGQGQSALLAALYGAERVRGGQIVVRGEPRRLRHPRHAIAAGIALIPGDRTREGLFAVRPVLENLALPSMRARTLASGVLSGARERGAARDAVERLSIKIGDLGDPVFTLSGGNQQKVVVGRWLLTDPQVVLMDDPTKGIDVGAKEELYEVMASLTADGVAIVFNSSENIELLDLSDRVLVLYEGRIVEELTGDELTEDRLLAASMRVGGHADGTATEHDTRGAAGHTDRGATGRIDERTDDGATERAAKPDGARADEVGR
jgi:ribose transport system ATP-binding protein